MPWAEKASVILDSIPAILRCKRHILFAEDAGSEDLFDVLESCLVAAVLAAENFAGIFFVEFGKLVSLFHGDGKGFFEEDEISGFEGGFGVADVVGREGGNGDQFHLFVSEKFSFGGVIFAVEILAELFCDFRIAVIGGCDFKFCRMVVEQFIGVHVAAGAAESPDANFDFFHHNLLIFAFYRLKKT